MKNDTIGVDVSKDHLDAYRLADGAARRFANTKGGHKALIKWLAETPSYRVVFEPTGPYHRAVERALGSAGVPFVKVNPRQARRFAEATGKLAKTDRLDAAILARMGALLELEARPARSEVLLELKELYVARDALVKDRTAAKNRGKTLTLSLLKRQNAQRLEQIDRQIATVEAAILQMIEANASLADRFAILTSIPGVSNITAFALLIAMPELGALEAGQAANLARPGPDRPTVRPLDRPLIHSRRPCRRPPGPLHASPRRCPIQSGHEGQIPTPHQARKARKSRLDRNHAKTPRPRKRSPQGQPTGGPKNRLSNTDTLAGDGTRTGATRSRSARACCGRDSCFVQTRYLPGEA
jgi:transposase